MARHWASGSLLWIINKPLPMDGSSNNGHGGNVTLSFF